MPISIPDQSITIVIDTITHWALQAAGAVAIFCAGWIAAKVAADLVVRVLHRAPTPTPVDPLITSLARKSTRITILIFTAITVLSQFGIQTTSMVAALGAAGLAIGLALQGSLSNVASGVMLLVLRPFNIGDAVRIGGEVIIIDDIGLFITTGHLPDGPKIVLPNTRIWGADIINFSVCFEGKRRINETFSIAYEDDIGEAIEVIRKTLAADSRILALPAPEIGVNSLGASSVDLFCRAYTNAADWWPARVDVVRKIKEAFDREGITIPFPQQVIRRAPTSSPS